MTVKKMKMILVVAGLACFYSSYLELLSCRCRMVRRLPNWFPSNSVGPCQYRTDSTRCMHSSSRGVALSLSFRCRQPGTLALDRCIRR